MVIVSRGVPTNLQLLKTSRKKQQPGDVFVLRIADDKYLFGRIIRNDALRTRASEPAMAGEDARANLAYIYNHVAADSSLPEMAALSRDRLLIPPFFVDRLWWSRGYFQTIINVSLAESDILPQHCFLWRIALGGGRFVERYYDEYSNELPERAEPVGSLALPTIGWIDSKLSVALGIPDVDYSQYE